MIKNKLLFVLAVLLAACSQNSPAMAEINSFEECVKAGNPIRKSLPAQCVTKEGKIYIDTKTLLRPPDVPPLMPNQGKICVDQCGDGQCAEIVCMAQGCPCPESKDSCPEDCGS